jgi:ankyrin repeat protein
MEGKYRELALDAKSKFINEVWHGNIAFVQETINHNPDCVHYTADYDSALHTAVKRVNYDMTKLLLDNKADVDFRGWRGFTPLASIDETSPNSDLVLKLLLEYGANLFERRDRNQNILHSYAYRCSLLAEVWRDQLRKNAKILFQFGASVLLDEEDRNGDKPYNIDPDLFLESAEK